MKNTLIALLAIFSLITSPKAEEGFISMFNGKDLTGWKSNDEKPNSFVVEDGAITTKNGRAHLFYVGADGQASFKNFIFKSKVLIHGNAQGSNSGIYVHTKYQADGWPYHGFECQVNSTKHKDPKKTGGLYAVKDVMDTSPVADDVWFDYEITVQDKHITIKINGVVTSDWTEPADWDPATALKNMPGRKFGEGTIAFQAHDAISSASYKDIFIKPL